MISMQDLRACDDGVVTVTSAHQSSIERRLNDDFWDPLDRLDEEQRRKRELLREDHGELLHHGIRRLPSAYTCLDASRPWLCYWIVSAASLMDDLPQEHVLSDVVTFLGKCVDPKNGGYGGGPQQLAHLAPTYAAINAISVMGTEEGYKSVDRRAVSGFLHAMKHECGGFRMHHDGEVDVRSTYCALAVGYALNVLTEKLVRGTLEYILACQTYEGGFGGEPGNEAHGGYTFCGLAGLLILKMLYSKCNNVGKLRDIECIDLDRIQRWTIARQMPFEGGFQGRTNKLVDSCYSFWVGALFPLLHLVNPLYGTVLTAGSFHCPLPMLESPAEGKWLASQRSLQDYLLMCCQLPTGGFRDKPPKRKDFYHTCYSMAGLSVMQNNADGSCCVVGLDQNRLFPVNPVWGVREDKMAKTLSFFHEQS